MALTLNQSIWSKIILSLITILSFIYNNDSFAHGYGTHNDELKSVLFGNQDKYNLSPSADKNFYLLCEAVWLTLDLTDQEIGRERLKHLRKFGVKNVPTFEEICFSSNAYHQNYTHYGWDKGYRGVEKNPGAWEKRKQLLLSTVEMLGDFKPNEKIKLDSFAALCYEIHILGDHIGDHEPTRLTRIRLVSEPGYHGQFISPDSDGPFNNPTLYTYLLYHLQRLFREQKGSAEYQYIIQFFKSNADKYLDYPLSVGEMVPYDKIKDLARETRDCLIRFLPALLKREAFFQRAFK